MGIQIDPGLNLRFQKISPLIAFHNCKRMKEKWLLSLLVLKIQLNVNAVTERERTLGLNKDCNSPFYSLWMLIAFDNGNIVIDYFCGSCTYINTSILSIHCSNVITTVGSRLLIFCTPPVNRQNNVRAKRLRGRQFTLYCSLCSAFICKSTSEPPFKKFTGPVFEKKLTRYRRTS